MTPPTYYLYLSKAMLASKTTTPRALKDVEAYFHHWAREQEKSRNAQRNE